MSKPKRIRTTLELSPENLVFWEELPYGERKWLINELLDRMRLKRAKNPGSIRNFLAELVRLGIN